jgi:serine protease Do
MDDSEESEHDLKLDIALIKLNDGETPNTFIPIESFELDDTAMKPGTKSIMIGYPLGLDLASTNDVLKVQMYNGEISKESDAFNIQYSITSTHGASGAPVFNECGKLIAINYGGLDQVQGFNFGIVANQLFEFCR